MADRQTEIDAIFKESNIGDAFQRLDALMAQQKKGSKKFEYALVHTADGRHTLSSDDTAAVLGAHLAHAKRKHARRLQSDLAEVNPVAFESFQSCSCLWMIA